MPTELGIIAATGVEIVARVAEPAFWLGVVVCGIGCMAAVARGPR